MATIVGEPMSTLPISPPESPTKPLVYHKRLPSDVLKPNPHPYPIKTTSTGILSRSNSTTKSNSPYQFYVPQSPGSPGKKSRSSRGDKERRGGRHRYSESLNSNTNPTPLPVPYGFASAPGYRERSGSTSSLSSVESGTADVFGEVTNNAIALSRRKHRAGTMPPSTAAAFEAAIAGSGLVPDGGDKRRGRTYHTMGRRSGGKVRGMVASFEPSSSRSGDEDEDGDKDAVLYQDYGHRRIRYRSGSEASDHSVGSSSSASPGPSRSHGSEPNLKSHLHESQEDSTPRRNQDQPRELESNVVPSEEPTMEQLLASFPYPNPLPTGGEPNFNIETMKLRDAVADPRTITIAATASSSTTAPVTAAESTGPVVSTNGIETAKALPAPLFSVPSSQGSMPVSSPRSSTTSAGEELTVEQLLALAAIRRKDGDVAAGASTRVVGGANAWERDSGCTVKRVEEAVIEAGSGVVATGPVVNGTGRRAKVPAEKDGEKRRLEDMFLPVGDSDKLKGKEETRAGPQSSAVDRQLRFEQDMSEAREMVRALSARVASVESRIGEMERAAGDLKVRGRKLMSENEVGTGTGKEEGKDNVDEDGTTCSKDSALRSTARPRRPTSSVVSLARAVVHGALDSVCTRLASVVPLPFSLSSSQPSSSATASASDPTAPSATETDSPTEAREVSKTLGSNAGIPMRYKRTWTCYLLFLGLGACAFILREVARRGLLLRGRLGPMRG